jgi:hypothetical protein
MNNYKLTVTVTSNSLSELIEYTSATPGATLESVEKAPGGNGESESEVKVVVPTQEQLMAKLAALSESVGLPSPDPRLVYKASTHPDHMHHPRKRVIDVDASLKNIGLTREWLANHHTKAGSIEHSIKRSIAMHGKRKAKSKPADRHLDVNRDTNLFKV